MDVNEKTSCGREQEIIEAAQKVFADYGYGKATMDDVAAKLNITRSALYYYYKSKEDLFVAVGEYDFQQYESELEKAIESAKTTSERFIEFCRCFLPMRKKFRDVYKLGNDDLYYSAGIHKNFKSVIGDIHTRKILDIFKKDKKIAKIDNLEYYAPLLTYSIRGIVFNSFDSAPDQLEYNILTLCRIFCQGLQGVASSGKTNIIKNDSGKKDK